MRIRSLLLAVAALLALGFIGLWIATPTAADVQPRVARLVGAEHSTLLRPGEVPPLLQEAVVGIEDERFFQHHGLDVVGLVRSGLYDASHGCLCQGGSTITQQLVKQVYLNGSDRGWAKVVDMIVALKVETVLNKQQILADYLSIVPTGGNRYGMAGAACTYFGRPLGELGLPEYALLAGIQQAPTLYNPLVHPDLASRRRASVLKQMAAEGYITQEESVAATAAPLGVGTAPLSCG